MKESLSIIEQCINSLIYCNKLKNFEFILEDFKLNPPFKGYMKNTMESLIYHFKLYSEGVIIPKEETSVVIEAPKGEFGVTVISNNTNIPFRCRIKAPGFLHLQGINMMLKNCLLADLVTIIGTQDLVFGEIDR